MYNFRIPFSDPPAGAFEVGAPDTIVEQSGWRSTEQIVSELMRAGTMLRESRLRGDFDFDKEITDDDVIDVSPMSFEDPVDRKIALDNALASVKVKRMEVKNAEVVKDQSSSGELSDQSPVGSGGIGSDK